MKILFENSGDRIFATNMKGKIFVFNTDTLELTHELHIAGASPLLHLHISRNGRYLLVNSTDCILRIYKYEGGEFELQRVS